MTDTDLDDTAFSSDDTTDEDHFQPEENDIHVDSTHSDVAKVQATATDPHEVDEIDDDIAARYTGVKPVDSSRQQTHDITSSSVTVDNANMAQYIAGNMDFILSCEIGKLNVTVNELLNFKAGAMLNFNCDLQQVKIMVNSVAVGFGQIVEIDGKYGVKITKVLSITDSLAT